MKILKQETYFPIIILIHFIFWAVDLFFYTGAFTEVNSDTLFFGSLENISWKNGHRIIGEVLSSWVVTVFAFNFLMATRSRRIERIFGGLDKMYLIHRRSGVIAFVLLVLHFVVVPRDLEAFTPGKPLGFYAFVLIIIGVFLSAAPVMKRKIPYHKWINFHKLMGVFYIMAVIHGIMVKSLIQELPITRIYVFGMAFVGVSAWFYKAFLYKRLNKPVHYKITAINFLNGEVTELKMLPILDRLNFKAGQFAFFKFPVASKKEQHPFTISSHPSENELRITVKALGDYTSELGATLSIGEEVEIEGPFGLFNAEESQSKQQVWVAGGIGITPFLAMSKRLDKPTHLVWCVKHKAEAVYLDELKAIEKSNSNFKIDIWPSDDKGYFKMETLKLQNPTSIDYMICGPQNLKDCLIKELNGLGVKDESIYDEEFSFR